MLSADQLAQFQATATAAMDLSITIQRATLARTALGGQSESYSDHATVNGNLSQPTASLLQNYDYLIGDLATWQVRMPVGTDVQANDRLSVAGYPLMRVQVVLQPQSYQTAVRLLASEVK